MFRKHVPDLDSLESPLISASPFGSILGAVPGSALAERIFNDPQSWQGADDDDGDLKEEAMTWLADEVEKYKANGEDLCLSPVDRDVDIMLKPFSERFKLAAHTESEKQTNWEDKLPSIPLFDHTSLDLSLNLDLRLSKIWDAKGKMFDPVQSPMSPVNKKSRPPVTDNTRLPAPPALDLASADSPVASPLSVASSSTTWSILELYGVHPNTPRGHGRVPLLTHYPPTPNIAKPPVDPPTLNNAKHPAVPPSLQASLSPATPATVRPSPSPPPQKMMPAPPMPESTPIRRLPLIPDSTRTTPSPSPSPAPTPPRTGSPERMLHRTLSASSSSSELVTSETPNGTATTPRRTPRSSATLPVPSSSPDPFNISPNVTPIRSGSLFTRSPPAGPRPRSGSGRQRNVTGRRSPAPVVIAPAPTPSRVRKPTPPPGLHLGVPA